MKHGYALAIHGSFIQDMDLILVPWVKEASPHEKVLKEWEEIIGIKYDGRRSLAKKFSCSKKPHGRVSYAIPTGGGGYVDVSIMPLLRP